MDLNRIIQELHRERERVLAMIQSLERMDPASRAPTRSRARKRPGRRPMNSAERQEVSRRMKLYWEQRKQQPSANIKSSGLLPE
jgi:hypothetical protein